jgi:predicted nucleic acid-binding protein
VDKDLLVLEALKGIQVVTPYDFVTQFDPTA